MGVPAEVIPRWSTHDVSDFPQVRDVLTDRLTAADHLSADRDSRYPDPGRRIPSRPRGGATGHSRHPGGDHGLRVEPPRGFDCHDMDFLSAIASNAATAIERSRLLARADHVAETLQRALLPESSATFTAGTWPAATPLPWRAPRSAATGTTPSPPLTAESSWPWATSPGRASTQRR